MYFWKEWEPTQKSRFAHDDHLNWILSSSNGFRKVFSSSLGDLSVRVFDQPSTNIRSKLFKLMDRFGEIASLALEAVTEPDSEYRGSIKFRKSDISINDVIVQSWDPIRLSISFDSPICTEYDFWPVVEIEQIGEGFMVRSSIWSS